MLICCPSSNYRWMRGGGDECTILRFSLGKEGRCSWFIFLCFAALSKLCKMRDCGAWWSDKIFISFLVFSDFHFHTLFSQGERVFCFNNLKKEKSPRPNLTPISAHLLSKTLTITYNRPYAIHFCCWEEFITKKFARDEHKRINYLVRPSVE